MTDKLTDVTDNKVGKITDSEIVKALEMCIDDNLPINKCEKCPATKECDKNPFHALEKPALDLINRLQAEKSNLEIELQAMRGAANSYKAEVERLKEENEKLQYYLDCECSRSADVSAMLIGEEKIKAEAYKECIEKLKKQTDCLWVGGYRFTATDLDNLYKELVGGDNSTNIDKQN